jgi:predicted AlkP superfamily phosphohydrolase/phosphomutase
MSFSQKPYLADVDWSQTQAYAMGLSGIYVNEKGRESQGIVEPGEPKRKLVDELRRKLIGLRDHEHDQLAIFGAVTRESVYRGPYVDHAPDVIVGYQEGYRVSWGTAVGKCADRILFDNTRAWSGDHCIHPSLVPGVLFSNLRLNADGAHITDLAPTLLELMGVDVPSYMEGKSLLCGDETSSS